MTTQLWCLLAGLLLPYVWFFATVPFRIKQFGAPDLNLPRIQAGQLEGPGARAWGAHNNAFEALLVFGIANLAAVATGVDPAGNWALASMIWVAARAVHGIVYIADIPVARVIMFATSLGMSLWILWMAFSVG